jgi:hypothetical protein
VALSISLSVLNLLPLTLLFRRVTGLSGFSASAAAVVYAASAYAWLFSGWGYHNMALNTFLWAALAGSFLRLDFPEATPTWAQLAGRLWPVTVATLVAAYSQQINVLLVPAGIAVYILVLPDVPGPVRIRAVVLYASAVVAGLAPVGLFASALHRVQRDFTSYANAGTSAGAYLTGLAERAGSWFLCARQIFSLPGTLAGAVGVGLLARRRARLPLVFLGVHFAAYCLIPGLTWAGGHTYLRTWNYVIPTLATGIAFLFVELFGKLPGSPLRWAATTLLGLLLALHLREQWPEQGFESWAKNRLGDFESTYLVGQGELRPIIHQMEARIQGAPILFWGLPEKYAFMALANSSEGVGLSVLTSDGMYSRNTRPTDFGPDGTRLEYVVASNEAGASDPFSAEALESALRRLYHSQPELQALGEYPVHSAWCRTLILYSARIHRPDSPEAAR